LFLDKKIAMPHCPSLDYDLISQGYKQIPVNGKENFGSL